ncbi:MAG: DUF3592 domain-containing protein [Planctomycetota bacterium]
MSGQSAAHDPLLHAALEPPADAHNAKLETVNGQPEASFKSRHAPLWAKAGVGAFLLLIPLTGLVGLFEGWIAAGRWGMVSGVGVAIVFLFLAGFVWMFISLPLAIYSTTIKYTREAVVLIENKGYQTRIPIKDLLAVRLGREEKRQFDVSFKPGGKMQWQWIRRTYLELLTRDGGSVRAMLVWGEQDTEWAVDLASTVLGLPRAADHSGPITKDPTIASASSSLWRLRDWWVLTVLVVATHVGFIIWGGQTAYRAWQLSDWVPVRGEITWLDKPDEQDHKLRLEYRYSVDDQDYQSQRLAYWFVTDIEGKLERNAEAGDAVTVYVDPGSPDRSVLEKRLPTLTRVLMTALAVIPFAGWVWLWWVWPVAEDAALAERYRIPPKRRDR